MEPNETSAAPVVATAPTPIIAPTPTIPAAKPRFALLDSARGLGILLVIYGHFLQSFFQQTAPLIAQQYQVIYSFHMPLFFVLSGMVGQLASTTLRKTLRGALELIALVLLMHLLGTGIDLLTRTQGTGWSTPEIFRDGFMTGNTTIGVMWFLLCLGLVRLTVGCALLIQSLPLRIIVLAVLLGLFALVYDGQQERWPVWQNTTLLYASLFFLIGRYVPLQIFLKLAHPAVLLLSIPATVGMAMYNSGAADRLHPIVMTRGDYNNHALFVIGALAGTIMSFGLVNLLRRSDGIARFLNSTGQQTLGLLLLNALYCAFLMPLIHLPADGLDSLTLTAAALGLTLLQILSFKALQPATDGIIALANWLARCFVRA